MSESPIVTLLSDFGLKDPYVAEMKAVILSICPNATIIDISHQVRKFDIRMGAFILAQAAPHFPEGTIHIAVVDPGVGTKRRPIIIEAKNRFYVGPDNGLLMLAARREEVSHIYEIANPRYMLEEVSTTFHGRDIFSPAAAHLARGTSPSDFGSETLNPVIPSFAKPAIQNGKIRGEVIHIDGFGNVITNITSRDLRRIGLEQGRSLLARLGDKDLSLRFCTAYGEVPRNAPLAIVGSSGFLEVAVSQGDASKTFKAKTGDRAVIEVSSP